MQKLMRVFVATEDGILIDESDLPLPPLSEETAKHDLPPIKPPPRRTWRETGKTRVEVMVEVWGRCAHGSCKTHHKIDKSFSFTAQVARESDPLQEVIATLGGAWPTFPIDWSER